MGGDGDWLLAGDGGILAFGTAGDSGSTADHAAIGDLRSMLNTCADGDSGATTTTTIAALRFQLTGRRLWRGRDGRFELETVRCALS